MVYAIARSEFWPKWEGKNIAENIEKLLEIKLKNYDLHMDTEDHPEFDNTDMLFGTDITMYQMLIGRAQWEDMMYS
eukprot:15366151-Ditylum_brightwellii.AAC.1